MVKYPAESVFFALRGAHCDGADFIPELITKGVREFVVDDKQYEKLKPIIHNLEFIIHVVPDVLTTLQDLAREHREQYNCKVIAITGSYGKTIAKEWLAKLLEPNYRVTKSPRSYNSQVGVPLSLWQINAQTEVALIEVGISRPGEMERLEQIVQPSLGVLTALGSQHDENFPTHEAKCDEKMKLFAQLPSDKYFLPEYPDEVLIEPSLARVRYTYNNGSREEYTLPFTDRESITHSYSCVKVALALDVTPAEIAERTASLTRVDGQGRKHLEIAAQYLQKTERVHETTLEISLSEVVRNLNHYKSLLAPGVRLTCMIKADAYGCGAVEIARVLQEQGVDYLAVAVADEGVALRRNGITMPIMVMNPEMNSWQTLFDYHLEPEINTFRMLEAFAKAGGTNNCHIKLDTGMARLGFNPNEDIDRLIATLKLKGITPRSVFSHFVGADGEEFDEFSTRQFELFTTAANKLKAVYPDLLLHMCNTAGMARWQDRQLDMCRLGIGLYENIGTLRTTILQIRPMKAGESVGYSRRTILDRDSVIAVLPIGYADGLNRHLGNRHGFAIVNGKPAPYVGNICMDICMVDVTNIPNVSEGDSVEIYGAQLPVTTIAEQLDTISYEVLTSIAPRVKRIYYYD